MTYESILLQLDEARFLYEARVENGADTKEALNYLVSDIELIKTEQFLTEYDINP